MTSIPIIDLSKLRTDRHGLANQLVDAMEKVGFAFLDNVEGFTPGTVKSLHDACLWFFGLPLERKLEISRKEFNPACRNVYRGYFPLVAEGPGDFKEGIEWIQDLPDGDPEMERSGVMYEKSQWPREDGWKGKVSFRDLLMGHHTAMFNTCIELMRLVAIGLGLEENTFDKVMNYKPLASVRIVHYPPRLDEPPPNLRDGSRTIQCAEHTDTPLITLLSTFYYGGLEIRDSNGEWMAAEPRPNSLVMNIGDLLVEMTGGRFKSTKHRVIDIGCDRYSVPFFMEPASHAEISRPFHPSLRADISTPCDKLIYGPWLVKTLKSKGYYEYKNTEM